MYDMPCGVAVVLIPRRFAATLHSILLFSSRFGGICSSELCIAYMQYCIYNLMNAIPFLDVLL